MNTRTIKDFTVNFNIWPIVTDWSQKNGYVVKQSDGKSKALYQKGLGLMIAPTKVEISQVGQNVHLEAWIYVNGFTRAMTFFILPSEIRIESGGIEAALPRKLARGSINILLQALGQPLLP